MGLLVGSRPLPMTLFPLMRLSGQSRNQETKWFSVCHLLMSYPDSLMTVVAVMTSMPSMRVRSVPVMRNNPSRKSNCGLFALFFLSRPWRFSSGRGAPWLRSSRCWRYCWSWRSHSAICFWQLTGHPVPVSRQRANPVASCLPDSAQSAPHSLSPGDPETQPVYFIRIAFARQNGLDDGLSGCSTDIGQHIGQLQIHLRQRLLHPQNMPTRTLHEIVALPPVGPHLANLL